MRKARLLPIATFVFSTLVAAPAFAAGVTPGAATPVQREQAQSRFLRGKELYGQAKYDAALAEFSASLDIVTSPNARLYVGRCLRDMNRLVAAYVELGRTMIEARELARDDPRYEKTAEAARDERAALEPKLAFMDISVAHPAPTTTLKVGGDEVRRGGWSEPVPILPGSADVVVETPGHTPITKNVKLVAGERKSLSIDAAADTPEVAVVPEKPHDDAGSASTSSSKSTLRTLAYVAGGVGVAGFVTFAIFGLKSNGTYSDLQKACPSGPCPPGHSDDISAGKTQQTVANVGLVVGIVGAAAGVTLFVLSTGKSTPSQPTASVSVGPSYIGMRGAF
jgi:hypothetical protein